jgi:hypothetical protein
MIDCAFIAPVLVRLTTTALLDPAMNRFATSHVAGSR